MDIGLDWCTSVLARPLSQRGGGGMSERHAITTELTIVRCLARPLEVDGKPKDAHLLLSPLLHSICLSSCHVWFLSMLICTSHRTYLCFQCPGIVDIVLRQYGGSVLIPIVRSPQSRDSIFLSLALASDT